MGRFFYSVRRGGDGHPDGGPTRRQKADGSMPVPRSFNEGGFAQGNEAQRNQSLRCYQNFPVFRDLLFCKKFPISSDFATLRRLFYIYWT